MAANTSYSGTCYCGAVTVTVDGPPLAAGYCHCDSCKRFHGAPFMAWAVWPSDAVAHTGEVRASTKSEHLSRVTCAACGGKAMGVLPGVSMTVVFPALLEKSGLDFHPQFHQFYTERSVDVADGLPKFEDKPAEFGGTGVLCAEPTGSGVRVAEV